MPNIFWYILLAAISVASAAYAIYVKRDTYKVSTLLVFYLFSAGLAWIGEFAVLGVFNAYRYNTGLFSNIWAQNLLGHLILNTAIYPSAAVVMAAYSLRYGWMAFVSAFLTLCEYFFVKLGIYEQHWWRFYMTPIIVIGLLLIDRMAFNKINEKRKGARRAVFFYFVALIMIHTPAPILLLYGKEYYKIGFFNKLVGDLYLASIMIIFSYHLIEAFLAVIFTCVLKKWYWKLMPFIISISVQSILAKIGVLVIQDGWKLLYTLILYELFIGAFVLIEKYTLRPEHTLFI